MIIKEKRLSDKRLIWYENKRNQTVYLFKITRDANGEENYKIIRKIPIKKESSKDYSSLLTSLCYSYYLIFCFMGLVYLRESMKEPEFSTYVVWDYLEKDNKDKLILRKINETLNENPNLPSKLKTELYNSYTDYISTCSDFITRDHYKKILESNKTVNFELLSEPIQKSEKMWELGYYNHPTNTIYCIEDYEAIFHEKLHSDDCYPNRSIEDVFYAEVHSSVFISTGYEDMSAAIKLIGELIDKELLIKSIVQKKPEQIWKTLEKEYPENHLEITELRNLLNEIYKKEYRLYKEVTPEKEDFWKNYYVLYYHIYKSNPENDVVVSYLKEKFFGETSLKNDNSIDYKETYQIGNLNLSLENRNKYYKDAMIEQLLMSSSENAKYFQSLWNELLNGLNADRMNSYREFEYLLQEKGNSKEAIQNTFYKMAFCNRKEDYYRLKKGMKAYLIDLYSSPQHTENTLRLEKN